MEYIQKVLAVVKASCPTLGNVACFMNDEYIVLQIHYYLDGEEIEEKTQEELESDPMDDGCKHMFVYCMGVNETDWEHHAQKIVERYQECVKGRESTNSK